MNGNRGEHPLLFAPLEAVADRLLAADAGMALATLKAMEPQPVTLEGHTSRASWGN